MFFYNIAKNFLILLTLKFQLQNPREVLCGLQIVHLAHNALETDLSSFLQLQLKPPLLKFV